MTQAEYDELFDRLDRVGLGGDPLFRHNLIRKLKVSNFDPADVCFRRLNDAQFKVHLRPLVTEVDREMTLVDYRGNC